MSPKNPRLHAAGLTVLGLFALAPLGVAADTPPAAALPAPVAPVAPGPVHSVLLLKNGKLHQGRVSDGGSVYYVHGTGGKIPIPKQSVETVARTIRDLYEYKVARLPERDPDEHMKLARWCLTYRLNEEAKEQLAKVVALSANDPAAREMLGKITDAEERAAVRDPEVARANVELPADRPESLDPAIIGRARRDMGISGLPQIPGLPTALAVKRSQHFAKYVEPVLQHSCVSCHNEQFPGTFRLIKYRTRHDRTSDAMRSNLDAVLAFISLEDPPKSELLSSTLRPHGNGTNKRPIYQGSNNQQYQILAAWVNSLRPPQPVAAARRGAVAAPEGEGFGSQRAGAAPMPNLSPTPLPPPVVDTRPQLPAAGEPVTPLPPGQFLPGSGVGVQPYAPESTEFPAPYLAGGPKPKMPAAPGAQLPPLPPPGTQAQAPAAGAIPPLPGQPQPAAGAAAAKTKAKPFKFDPALLEKALMNRYTPPPQ